MIMRNYLIIGCSSGIGKALTEKLAAQNRVFGTYFKNTPQFSSANISTHGLNVLEDDPRLEFLPDTLHGLVYCPGAINLKPFGRCTEDDFLRDYRLQVTGAVKVIQACVPRLKKSGEGSIVLFSTVAVTTGFSFHSIVSSNKGAVEGLTRALAAELSPAIRVNCIAPSITDTPLAAGIINTAEKKEASAQRHALKRIGSPEDVAQAAAYLLTNESRWVTGQILHVDGGMSAVK
jgi:NAD(P)-dependent dehydrogenase (short-subunit alcohol dehydrogenase family)